MTRTSAWQISLASAFVFAAMALAVPAGAATITGTDYDATMAELDQIETLIRNTASTLQSGMSRDEARTTLPHLQERLQWIRDTKVAAARIDTSHTLRTRNADSQRAQCIIMRAGLMDETFQDVMVNVSMKARGVGDEKQLPISAVQTTGALKHCSAK
jgi:hypothetical protein